MADHYLRKYGAATIVDFRLYKLDGTGFKSDAASATHDIKIMKDEGAEADTTADAFVDEGQGYSLALTATEMEAARIVIYIVDLSSPQVWLDTSLTIETYGNASAQHIFDLGTATVNLSSTSETQIDDIQTDVAAVHTHINDIHDTDLPAVKTDTAAIKTMTDKIGTVTNTGGTASIGAILGDFANVALVTKVGTVTTDVAAVHVHVGTIDGHITADYTATEKAAIDLLDDAAGGLVDIHTDVGTTITNIGDVHVTDLPALKTVVDNIHDTDLPAVKTDTGNIATNATILKKIGINKWAIVGTQMIIYDDNGSTPLYTFNLDSVTTPTSRTPV